MEEVIIFGTPPLSGILCRPDGLSSAGEIGVVMLSPGLLHRVGPNRFYVKIARALAADGFSVLRFDYSGQGESPPRIDHLPHQYSRVEETRMAMDHLIGETGCSRVLLVGHCSGAILSFMTAFEDERVAGVVAISPRGVDESWEEFDRRQKESRYYANYYGRSTLTDSGRWRRLLTGQADYTSIARNVLRNIVWYRVSTLAYRMRVASGMAAKSAEERPEVLEFKAGLRSLAERRLPILVIHPDQSAEQQSIRAALGDTFDRMHEAGHLETVIITESDHVFSPLAAQEDLVETVRRWVPETNSTERTLVASGGEAR